jgi:hypothetical protein
VQDGKGREELTNTTEHEERYNLKDMKFALKLQHEWRAFKQSNVDINLTLLACMHEKG